MRAVEPVAEMRGGLIWCLAIERHHRCRHARNPDDVRTPALFGDPRHFNDKGSTGNSSFKTVPHDGYLFRKLKREAGRFYGSRDAKQAKRSTKAARHRSSAAILSESDEKKILLSRTPQEIHHPSTGFAHPPSSRQRSDVARERRRTSARQATSPA